MKRNSRLPRLPLRRRDAHKGEFGRVLIVGGSQGMIGAPGLAAQAALRAGAGLVTIAVPEPIQPFVAILCPCATTVPLPADPAGRIDPARALNRLDSEGLLSGPRAATVAAIGPGLSLGDAAWCRGVVEMIQTSDSAMPIVVDADALNAMSVGATNGSKTRETNARESVGQRSSLPVLHRAVLTPHPGEAGRLMSMTTGVVQGDRESAAQAIWRAISPQGALERANDPRNAKPNLKARRSHAARRLNRTTKANGDAKMGNVVVLKGAGTLVTDGRQLYVNRNGNPGMATGGAGDVLTGIIAALIGQGLSPMDAAILGVFLHGAAGDLAAAEVGEVSLTAGELIDWLPDAMRLQTGKVKWRIANIE